MVMSADLPLALVGFGRPRNRCCVAGGGGVMDVVEVLSTMVALDVASADLLVVRDDLGRVAQLRSWLDAREIALRRRLDDVRGPFGATADQELARSANTSRRDADRVNSRARMIDEVPRLGDALADGHLTGAHVDVFDRRLKALDPSDRHRLIDGDSERLVRLATKQSPDEFARTIKDTVAAAHTDGGIAHFDRQRRATRLTTWTDRLTGMTHLHGQFDPESAMTLLGRLRTIVEDLVSDTLPDTCPTDPSDKQDHLRALALIALVNHTTTTTSAGRPDLIVVVDEQTLRNGLHDHTIIDLGVDTTLPVETLRRIACDANIIPIVL